MPVEPAARQRLLGDLRSARGVLHATAVWASPDGRWITLQQSGWAPSCPTDQWVLDATRAWAEVVVTTGANLRAEPGLEIVVRDAGLAAWRKELWPAAAPAPVPVVLTRGEALPLTHPVLTGSASVAVATAPGQETHILDNVPRAEVMAGERMGVRALVEELGDRGFSRIAIEAGPSTSSALYEPPVAVDWLLLSTFRGELDVRARGGALRIGEAQLAPRWSVEVVEADGRWTVAWHDAG